MATNDGNTTLSAVTITDPKATGLSCTPANGSSLAPGASMTCTASHAVTQADIDAGHYFNQACVETPTAPIRSCDDVDVPVGRRTRTSTIAKDADRGELRQRR